jgi:hypothetical protein
MSPETPWPPRVGEPLSQAAAAYAAPEKLAWILSDEGHGQEWARVLHIGEDDTRRFWGAIAHTVIDAPISAIRDVSPYGANYEVPVTLALESRTAATLTIWHYDGTRDAPRLVTAYPRL